MSLYWESLSKSSWLGLEPWGLEFKWSVYSGSRTGQTGKISGSTLRKSRSSIRTRLYSLMISFSPALAWHCTDGEIAPVSECYRRRYQVSWRNAGRHGWFASCALAKAVLTRVASLRDGRGTRLLRPAKKKKRCVCSHWDISTVTCIWWCPHVLAGRGMFGWRQEWGPRLGWGRDRRPSRTANSRIV